ncbi:SIR2 family protein [Xanthomonas cannabis]|uniref:SIR2 family protein n=1 Tax=Xanthomonas cannabis TaxID=1885674 RepID=UPI00163F4B3C|nr:SIR2 family protein [Xanthomonas cannabis]
MFTGSGVSAHAKTTSGDSPKTWAGLTDILLDGVPSSGELKRLRAQYDYLTLCEIAEQYHGQPVIGVRLQSEYLTPAFSAQDIHRHIFALDARIVATPNFDKIYETFANHQASGTVIVKQYYDADIAQTVRGSGRIVLKIHGTIDAPAQCILTRKSYAMARSKNREFYEILAGLFLVNTFLFIGCGFSDPDVRLLLEDSKFRFLHSSPHYFLVPKEECSPALKSALESSLNIKIIFFSKKGGYHDLIVGLEALAINVEEERDRLRISGNW